MKKMIRDLVNNIELKFQLIIVLLFISFTSTVNAQNDQIILVDSLIKKAEANRESNLKRSQSIAENALQIATKIKYNIGIALAYKNIATIHLIQSDFEKSIEIYQKAITFFKASNYVRGVADCYNNIALAFSMNSKFDSALIYYQKTLQIEQWLDDKVSIAQTTENIGIAHYYRGNPKVAMSYFLRAAVLFYKIKEFQLLNRTIVSISSIISDLGYHELSIKLHQTALFMAIKYDNLRIMSTCYNNIGFSYSNLENYNKALEYLNYSIEIKEILGDKEGLLITLGVMGSVYQAQERYALSNKIYTDIIKISEEIDDKRQVAIGLTYIGENLAKQQEYTKSINYYLNSLELLLPLKAMNEIRDNYLCLSYSTYHLYDFAKTAKYYKQYKAYCDSTSVY